MSVRGVYSPHSSRMLVYFRAPFLSFYNLNIKLRLFTRSTTFIPRSHNLNPLKFTRYTASLKFELETSHWLKSDKNLG